MTCEMTNDEFRIFRARIAKAIVRKRWLSGWNLTQINAELLKHKMSADTDNMPLSSLCHDLLSGNFNVIDYKVYKEG